MLGFRGEEAGGWGRRSEADARRRGGGGGGRAASGAQAVPSVSPGEWLKSITV